MRMSKTDFSFSKDAGVSKKIFLNIYLAEHLQRTASILHPMDTVSAKVYGRFIWNRFCVYLQYQNCFLMFTKETLNSSDNV